MRVLILGLSSIARRRVLPALARLAGVDAVDIASRGKSAPESWDKKGRFFADYDEAVAASDAELVYVSLPNRDHAAWIGAALAAGRHVIVDKPATLTLGEARACVGEASRRSLLLAEATVFSYHSQVDAMRRFVEEHGPLTHVDAQFVIPPLPPENFRNHRRLGGGCLNDMGPYAAAVARLFGNGVPTGLCAFAAPPDPDRDIDMGFTFAASFESGMRMTGHFSFESEYQNRLSLIARGGSLAVERVFSPPPDLPPVWQVRRASRAAEESQPADDAFQAFLGAALDAIAAGRHQAHYDDLLSDAAFRARIASALGYGEEEE